MLFRWGENVYTEKIDRFFRAHREEFLTDLAQLVAVNSVKGEPEPGKPYGAGPARALELALRNDMDFTRKIGRTGLASCSLRRVRRTSWISWYTWT